MTETEAPFNTRENVLGMARVTKGRCGNAGMARRVATTVAAVTLAMLLSLPARAGEAPGDDRDVKYMSLVCAVTVWKAAGSPRRLLVAEQLIASMAQAGDCDGAISWARTSARELGPGVGLLTAMEYCRAKLTTTARRLALFRALGSFVLQYPLQPEGDEASHTWHQMGITGLAVLARHFVREGFPTLAWACLALAELKSASLQEAIRSMLLTSISFGHALLGNPQKSRELQDLAMKLSRGAPQHLSRTTLMLMNTRLAAEPGLQDAVQRQLELDKERLRSEGKESADYPDHLWSEAFLAAGDSERAIELARRNPRATSRLKDLCAVAEALLDAGETAKAQALLPELQEAVGQPGGSVESRVEAATAFVRVLSRLGELERAWELWQQALDTLVGSDLDDRRKADELANLAVASCRLGDYRRGFELLASVTRHQKVVDALLEVFVLTRQTDHVLTEEEQASMKILCPEMPTFNL
jgi:hypothetical protein